MRGRERFVSALSQVKCRTAGVPEHVAELEWFVTRRATKSHRAVNEFSNVATVQRLSPVGYIRPKRSAPRSSSLFPHVHFMPSVLYARTNVLEPSTDKCARGPAGFKLSSFPAGETHMCLMFSRRLSISHIRSRYERTSKVSAVRKIRNISQEKYLRELSRIATRLRN